jgi:hypothetical protein
MSKENSTSDIYNKLTIGLLYPMVIYLPKYLLGIVQDDKRFIELKNFVGILFSVENEAYNFIVDMDDNLFFMLNKGRFLESNMFHLIDAKETLKNEQFIYLLNKYKAQVDAWTYGAQVLQKDIETEIDPLFVKNKSYVIYQATILEQHQYNLEQQFVDCDKGKYEIDLKSTLFKNIEDAKRETLLNQPKTIKKSTTKKQPILLNSDVDNYLLKHVFGVNVDK